MVYKRPHFKKKKSETTHVNGPLTLNKNNELTEKEMTILRLVAKGMANRNIAFKLNLSLHYIKLSLSTIFIKLGVSSRTEAVAIGLKSGILSIDDFR